WPLGLEVAGGQNYSQYSWHGARFETIRPGCYDPRARLLDMDLDGIDAAVVFPSVGMKIRSPNAVKDPEFGLAVVQAYNDGILEWCLEGDPDRLIPLPIIPGFGLDYAVAELERVLQKGAKAVYITTQPNGSDEPAPEDDRFWARCAEAGVPVNIHVSLARGDVPVVGAPRAEAW